MTEKNLKIIQLTAENIKRLQAVTITPEGSVEIIGGDNAQGKTSCLDAIEMALNGGKSIPPNPIRRGQKKARVVVDLGELKVERRFTNKGSILEVTAANGLKQNSPQAILDELTGKLTFDPLAFIQMKATDQLKTLKDLVGINFDDLEVKRQNLYAERTELNRDVKNLEGQLEGIPEHEDAPTVIVVSDLMAQLDTVEAHNREVATQTQQVESLNAQITALEEEAERLLAGMNAIKSEVEAKVAEREWIDVPTLLDTAELKAQIASAETINQKAREVEERKRVEKLLKAKRNESTKLSLAIENIDGEKEARLTEAKFPVPNLSFGENGVLLNNLPLEQASAAEALKVSVAMGFALNPRLKVLLIRDGSLLDEHSLRTVAEMAQAHDGQVWIERVSKGAECSVIIENGLIAEKEDGWE